MDFKQLVMNEVDTKYQEMSKGTTDKPFAQTPTVSSNSTYEKKREDYYRRLNREHSEFNKAVNQIVKTRNARLKDEDQRRREKERKRAERSAAAKKFIKTILILAIIGGALAALIGLVIWPKMIYPNMDADSLYTPEILQSYCMSEDGQDEIFTFTECSSSGQVSATWEIYSDDGSWKINLTGKITEKKNSGDLVIQWTSNEVVYKPNSGSWTDEVSATITDNYKTLKTDADTFTAGVNDEYTISTADDFKKLANSNKTYHLKNDIDLSGKKWTPIEGFTGMLLGNGHTISNFTIESSSSNVGFFATMGGTIKDVDFQNANINVSGRNENVGIVAGYSEGIFENVTVSGVINADQCENVGGICGYVSRRGSYNMSKLENTANISGASYVGGIFGRIINEGGNNKGDINFDSFVNSGAVKGSGDYVGGLIGHGLFNDSYGNYKVMLTLINSSNSGTVRGANYVGGLFGYAKSNSNSSSVTDCTATGAVNGESNCDKVAGKMEGIAVK